MIELESYGQITKKFSENRNFWTEKLNFRFFQNWILDHWIKLYNLQTKVFGHTGVFWKALFSACLSLTIELTKFSPWFWFKPSDLNMTSWLRLTTSTNSVPLQDWNYTIWIWWVRCFEKKIIQSKDSYPTQNPLSLSSFRCFIQTQDRWFRIKTQMHFHMTTWIHALIYRSRDKAYRM